MKLNNDSALKVAEFLLQIKAIKLEVANPFTWASGWKSPIYCDNRKTLSYPKIRTYIRQQFVKIINEEFGVPDVIAGVATVALLTEHWLRRIWVYLLFMLDNQRRATDLKMLLKA